MSEIPQIYLVSPATISREFTDTLGACLDAVPVGCVRLSLPGQDADAIARAADQCREITDARDVALVLDTHIAIVARLGLDGVHLEGARNVAAARKELGADAIVGTFCGTSRHEGMSAGERGADYASFGPVSDTGLGDGSIAPLELFEWWSQMIELPIVAEGGMSDDAVTALTPYADFLGFGAELWQAPDPVAEIKRLFALLGG